MAPRPKIVATPAANTRPLHEIKGLKIDPEDSSMVPAFLKDAWKAAERTWKADPLFQRLSPEQLVERPQGQSLTIVGDVEAEFGNAEPAPVAEPGKKVRKQRSDKGKPRGPRKKD